MKNNSDKFETTKSKSFEATNTNENFFLQNNPNNLNFDLNQTISKPYKNLNNYDSELLEEDAYKDVSDELFKLEYKISRTEKDLKNIDSQIQAARDISDYNLIEVLNLKKKTLNNSYNELIAIYNQKSLSARISESLTSMLGFKLKTKFSNIQKKVFNLSETILLRLPKPFAASVKLKKSLNKLENINKSVDELIGLNNYNDDISNKYEQLSKYIVKANNIQSQINKYLKD